jgi:hypothetical protein
MKSGYVLNAWHLFAVDAAAPGAMATLDDIIRTVDAP